MRWRSHRVSLTDTAVKTAKRHAAEATLDKVSIGDDILENVLNFEYLGSRLQVDVRHRMDISQAVFGSLNHLMMLFIIFMDNIMKRANHEGNSIEELMFADDLVLIAEDQSRLPEMVSNLDQQCKNYGMRISRDKTEVMVTSREPIQCDIELDGETLKQV